MTNAQTAVNITTATPTQAQLDQLAAAIGEGIGTNAAHEIGHLLVNGFTKSNKIVNGMDMDDNSQDTYNTINCAGSWNYTGAYNGTPIHWSTNADQSLINIYGKKPQ